MSNNKIHELYRTKEQIISDILNSLQKHEPNGLQKIHLIYYARLSSGQLKQYLPYLLDNNMIIVDWSNSTRVAPSKTDPRKKKATVRGNLYHISNKGLEYLNRYQDMQHVVSESIQI